MSDCIGSQFEIIAKAKEALLDSTNIDTNPDEMKVLNNFLFRCWQMGWLDKYEKDLVEVVRCKDCRHHEKFCFDDSKLLCWVHDTDIVVSPTDYCSCGKRKEQENDGRRV